MTQLIVLAVLVLSWMKSSNGLVFTVEPRDQIVALSQPLWWHCQALDGDSLVIYRWKHGNILLPENENEHVYNNGTLLIRQVSYNDIGKYSCTVMSVDSHNDSREATLEIAYVSTVFSENPVSQTKMLGDTVVMTCMIESLPAAEIHWLLNDQFFKDGTFTTGDNGESTLTISPVLYSHAGTYRCVATNPVISVFRYSLEATLIVKGQPVFLSSLQPVTVPLDYTATFTCHFHGNPEPKVTWYMHRVDEEGSVTSRELTTSSKYTVEDNGILKVYNSSYDDQAFYTCTAGNVYGELSESAQLTVSGPARAPFWVLRPQNLTVLEGNEIHLSCGCLGNPQPTVYWQRNGTTLQPVNSTYTITETQSMDTDWYTCVCENEEGKETQSVYLKVHTHPAITEPPTDMVTKLGDSLLLHCMASGDPQPSVTWSTPAYGDDITMGNTLPGVSVYSNGSLYIVSTTRNDAGVYTCTATNIVGDASSVANVTIEEPPLMTLLPLSQGIIRGHSVYLHCQASGVPAPTYSWSKDGEGDIVSSDRRQIYLNNTLVVHRVTLADTGVYRCTADNKQGRTYSVATVTVTVPPEFTSVPENQTAKVGENVTLTCHVTGVPVPTQWWLKDGSQLQISNNMVISQDESQLTIAEIAKNQFGEYTCVASNVAATVSVTALVTLSDVPRFTVYPQDITVNSSDIVTLPCAGQAVEPPSVTWFRGLTGETTLVQSSDRVTILDNRSLIIEKVHQGDEDWYTCQLENSATMVTHSAFVNVQVAPTIIHTNSPQSAIIQSELSLTCQSTGDPNPVIQWLKPNGLPVTNSPAYVQSDQMLKIASTNQDDIGEWTCKYCNILGCDTVSVIVSSVGLPTIENFTAHKTGGTIELECIASSQPEPSISFWSKDDVSINDLSGHQVEGNTLVIEETFVLKQYTCKAVNMLGLAQKTVTVPSQMTAPTVKDVGSSWITLSMDTPERSGNLLLTSFTIQATTDISDAETWADIRSVNAENGQSTPRLVNLTGLHPYTEYMFRVIAENLLGKGVNGLVSETVRTMPGVPAPARDVVVLDIGNGTVLVSWSAPQSFNGPEKDVVYQLTLSRVSSKGNIVLAQRTIFSNQTLQLEINGLLTTENYQLSLRTNNTVLGLASEPVTQDFTLPTVIATGAETQRSESSLTADKIIAIVFGSLGGVFMVLIIVFVVTRVRQQRKSKSLSLVEHRQSLDQFYMENSRSLCDSENKSMHRRSGISFYSFDGSYHSNRSLNKAGKTSPLKGSVMQNDVLLVAKNPLYKENEQQPFLHIRNGNIPSKRESTCLQSEIELQEQQTVLSSRNHSQSKHTDTALKQPGKNDTSKTDSVNRPLEINVPKQDTCCHCEGEKAGTEELQKGVKRDGAKAPTLDSQSECLQLADDRRDHSLDQVYSSFASDSSEKKDYPTLHLRHIDSEPDNESLPSLGPPIRVLSPEYLGDGANRTKSSEEFQNTHSNHNHRNHVSPFKRDTRSASPSISPRDCNSDTVPLRVKSLDYILNCKGDNLSRNSDFENRSSKVDTSKSMDKKSDEKCVENFLTNEESISNVPVTPVNCDKPRKREKIVDNFLSEEEIKLESDMAKFY